MFLPYKKIIKETEFAYLLELTDEYKKHRSTHNEWFPKSKCTIFEKESMIDAPDWILKRKKLYHNHSDNNSDDNSGDLYISNTLEDDVFGHMDWII